MGRPGTTLYVTGFGPGTRAKDLAYEFERLKVIPKLRAYGVDMEDLCDAIFRLPEHRAQDRTYLFPSLPSSLHFFESSRTDDRSLTPPRFAFVEYEDRRDAEDAYHQMHNRRIDSDIIGVEWARNTPSASWRFDGDPGANAPPPRREYSSRPSYRNDDDRGEREYRRAGRKFDRESQLSKERPRSYSPPARRSPSPRPYRAEDNGNHAVATDTYPPLGDKRYDDEDKVRDE
ncbi:Pre-mRNA-splicing factor srp1 [Neolecta irregularis DAH-3]|uniref:Pre-mRNA-splicing factor srp1 n=1 Tax=Neolecta irregularis (strain DAH-3) TaxID=1198029 RepID=A0A1U7LQM1_NEOID|nr:Pre-mRNA-splicing factor srp1 [Neolecta irregularis DAH-3]|eukprot:OLL24929.1 Pre-mRNA-splicing factor srp1 [Neolecta irregularis DAH-3]